MSHVGIEMFRVKPLEAGLDRGLFDDCIDDGEKGFLDCW
jgi:hypothetical protein